MITACVLHLQGLMTSDATVSSLSSKLSMVGPTNPASTASLAPICRAWHESRALPAAFNRSSGLWMPGMRSIPGCCRSEEVAQRSSSLAMSSAGWLEALHGARERCVLLECPTDRDGWLHTAVASVTP
jgi:hypothetical protein